MHNEHCASASPSLVFFPTIILPFVVTPPIMRPSRLLHHSNRSWSAGSSSSLCLIHLFFGMNDFTFPCSFSKTVQHFYCFLEVISLCHKTRLKIWVATFHRDGVLVVKPLMIRRSVRGVNRVQVIQIFAISFSPPYSSLCHMSRTEI